MKKNRAVTIRDIAKLAGVSHSTVSRALNDSPLVSEYTKQKIRDLAENLQFSFNTGARSLRGGQTGIVAVIYPAAFDAFGSSLYAQQLLLDLRRALEALELDTILIGAYNDDTGESHVRRLIRQNRVDGFLLIHGGLRREDYRLIRENGLPLVQLHTPPRFTPLEELDSFLTDNEEGGYLATRHLLETGARTIITLQMEGAGRPSPAGLRGESDARTAGYRRALEEAGLPFDPALFRSCPCDFQAAYRLVHREPELFRRADGLFAQADILAFGVLTALKEQGVTIPEAMKIVGFDDSPLCLLPEPQLSTVHQPRQGLSRQAARRLKALLDGEATDPKIRCLLSPTLVVRGSSASAQETPRSEHR